MFGVLHKVRVFIRKLEWKSKYKNENGIIPISLFPMDRISVGKQSYGELKIVSFGGKANLRVGNYVSIANNVTFLLSADHYLTHISSFPFKAKTIEPHSSEAVSKGDIIVDDDVWIGYGATIMSGVHIGQGAIVAAGAVVTKDVPPYAIVGGVPAKVIKYRFESEMIEELLKVDYSKLSKEMIEEHIDDLYTELTVPAQLDWMPKNQCNENKKTI